MEKTDSVVHIARDLAMRIRWEEENGCPGYDRTISHNVDSTSSAKDPLPGVDGVQEALIALREEIGNCTRCTLYNGRRHIVFGEGSPNAYLAFVGEGPGRDEDLVGRPFVGAAGQLLDRIIAAMGLVRTDVYICNIVKCRPPDNRVPDDNEQRICGRFLKRQLHILQPGAVVALGGTATQFLLGSDEPVGRLRGRFHKAEGLKIMPTYHPAYLLRNPSGKRQVWEDMKKVMAELGLTVDIDRKQQ